MKVVLGGILIIAVLIWLLPEIPVSFLGAVMIVVFGFFFATVSSRMVGIVGVVITQYQVWRSRH